MHPALMRGCFDFVGGGIKGWVDATHGPAWKSASEVACVDSQLIYVRDAVCRTIWMCTPSIARGDVRAAVSEVLMQDIAALVCSYIQITCMTAPSPQRPCAVVTLAASSLLLLLCHVQMWCSRCCMTRRVVSIRSPERRRIIGPFEVFASTG